CHDLVFKADKKKALSLSDKRNPEEEKAIEKSIKETTSDLLAKRSAIVNSIRQSASNFFTGYNKELAKVSPDQKVLNGLQVTDIKRLLALYSRDPAEVYSLALSAILLSLKNNNRSQADVKAMCDMIVKEDGKLYDGEDLVSFATIVAGSVPPNFNRVLPAQVSSNYIGSTRIYSKDLASEEGGDPIPHLGTGLDVIQVDTPSSSSSWFMYRSSHIALVKSLMSDHIASTFDENEKKIKEEIENNFAVDDTSGLNRFAKDDIDKKVQELEATGIFGQRGLELEPQTDEIEQLKGENEEEKRQIILVRNVNNFIKKQTKSSIIKALSDAGFDDTYYDALMTCVARRLGRTFNEALTRNVVTRYSSKKEMSQSLSVGGEVVVESEEGPEETGGFAGGRSEDAERERILRKGDMENFVYKWINYPSYKTDGSIGIQSLPGFLARAMYKAELASQGDEAAKRFIENMTSSTEKLSRKKLLKHPLMMVLKNSVRLAAGHELFEVPARKNLADLLSYNQAAGSDIVSYKDVARDIGLFTDPLYASDKLAAGDSRGDSYELFFSRMIMKAGHMKVTDYSLWKAGMQEELEIYRKQSSARLDSMLARG
ncbi:hypothetical protein EBR25_13635, partial [bacterium]|nr:hypothetical protein [bacterium]